jgi:hypothetical protein
MNFATLSGCKIRAEGRTPDAVLILPVFEHCSRLNFSGRT